MLVICQGDAAHYFFAVEVERISLDMKCSLVFGAMRSRCDRASGKNMSKEPLNFKMQGRGVMPILITSPKESLPEEFVFRGSFSVG